MKNEGSLKKWLVYQSVVCRVFIFFALFLSCQNRHVTPDEGLQLLALLLPVSLFTISLSLKYTLVHKRYFTPGKQLSTSYFIFAILPILLLHLAEFSIISLKGTWEMLERNTVFQAIALLESLVGIYAGFYLSELFRYQHSD